MEEGSNGQDTQKPFRIETVRGEPYRVGGRTLVPEARVMSFTRAKATIGSRQVGGWGGAFVQVTPTALIEQTPDGDKRIPLGDSTSQATLAIMAIGAAVVVGLTLVRLLVRMVKRAT